MIEMNVVQPNAQLVDVNKLKDGYDNQDLPTCYYTMEHIGRICYNSYKDEKTEEKLVKFLKHGASRGHRSIFEFGMLHFSVSLFVDDYNKVMDRLIPNKYIKLSSTTKYDDEFIVTIKGSPRALIEILEDYVTDDEDMSMVFYTTLYEALQEQIHCVISNWETFDSIYNYNELAQTFTSVSVEYYIEDITGVYASNDMFTKYLFQVQCSRAETHEIVRHRPCSFMQASQRYIRFNEKNPYLICVGTKQMEMGMLDAIKESAYRSFEDYTALLVDHKPEDARVVLPNVAETKIFIYCDKNEYMHFDRMRTSVFAYPPVKEVFDSVHQQLINKKFI